MEIELAWCQCSQSNSERFLALWRLSNELRNIVFFFILVYGNSHGLIETHSWNMHLRWGDGMALSLAENTHHETCQTE